MRRLVCGLAALSLIAMAEAQTPSEAETFETVNPCLAKKVQRKIKTRDSLDDKFSRYRRNISSRGKTPFGPISDPVTAAQNQSFIDVLQLETLTSFDPIPTGWFHQEFRRPSEFSLRTIDGQSALRGVADRSASIMYRHMNISGIQYPTLQWRWRVDEPIVNPHCDHIKKGDDKSARIFVTAIDDLDRPQWFEIVWANHLQPGDLTFVHGFPHYVAAGPDTPLREWVDHEVDLQALFKSFWPNRDLTRITGIGFMIDGDQAKVGGSAALASVTLQARAYP